MKKKILFGLLIVILLMVTGCKSDNSKEEEFDFTGKWETEMAVNATTGTKAESLREVFGSSYSEYGSYLELKSDGTFFDAIMPITNGSKANTGTYEVVKDYNKVGDTYIILSYEDGNQEKLERVYYDEDEKTPYLVLEELVNDYQLSLRKKTD